MGSGPKPYMRKGFLIYEEMRKFFLVYEDSGGRWSYMTFHLILSYLLIYEENFILFFISVSSNFRPMLSGGCVSLIIQTQKKIIQTLPQYT
jgi:hypothetical protein